MRLRKLGIAMLAVVALGAIAVSSASAAATTTRAEWYTGASPGTTLPVTAEPKPIETEIKSGTTFVLETKVGAVPQQEVKLEATGVECKGCKISNKENITAEKPGAAAFGTGEVNFTGVTAVKPSTCAVQSEAKVAGQVLSKPLNVHADWMNGTTAVQQFIPVSGKIFAGFRLVNKSEKEVCPVAGLYSVTGSLFGDASNPTGTQATTQQVNFSPTIQTNDVAELDVSGTTANLTGSGIFFLPGKTTAFGVH